MEYRSEIGIQMSKWLSRRENYHLGPMFHAWRDNTSYDPATDRMLENSWRKCIAQLFSALLVLWEPPSMVVFSEMILCLWKISDKGNIVKNKGTNTGSYVQTGLIESQMRDKMTLNLQSKKCREAVSSSSFGSNRRPSIFVWRINHEKGDRGKMYFVLISHVDCL